MLTERLMAGADDEFKEVPNDIDDDETASLKASNQPVSNRFDDGGYGSTEHVLTPNQKTPRQDGGVLPDAMSPISPQPHASHTDDVPPAALPRRPSLSYVMCAP